MERYGPLLGVSQYWVERYIGWIKHRRTAKNRAAKSMFMREKTRESYRYFFQEPFQQSSAVERDNDVATLRGPCRRLQFPGGSAYGVRFRRHFSHYLRRKFETITDPEVEALATAVNELLVCSGIRTSSSSSAPVDRHGMDNIGCSFDVHGNARSKIRNRRWDWVIAVEMNDGGDMVDGYYGRLRYILQVDLSNFDGSSKFPVNDAFKREYLLADIDWTLNLGKGSENQIFFERKAGKAFTASSFEDISIIKRLLTVIQRAYTEHGSHRAKTRMRTYFVDDNMRYHNLLKSDCRSADNVNRLLRGFGRR
ncbi:hypothetical protein FGB62_92g115 [Gracilaria domingensis]|nr:hypothetical protein FGB62_92g115 [Gracilaria domingensis]